MSNLILPSRFTSQPQYAAPIDPTQGVAHAWALNILGNRSVKDSAGNADGTFGAGTGGTTGNYWVLGPNGWEILFDNTGTGVITSLDLLIGSASGSAAPSSTKWTWEADLILAAGAANQAIFGGADSGIEIRSNGSNQIELLKQAVASIGSSTAAVTVGARCKIAITYNGTAAAFYINGKASGTSSSAQTFTHGQYYLGAAPARGERLPNGSRLGRVIFTNRVLSAAEIKARYDRPWQIFVAPDRLFFGPSAGSAVALAGNAAAIASAAGALSTAVPIVGAAVGVTTATGALSTAMRLTGAAAAVSAAAGNLTLGIALSGAAIEQAVASGAIKTQFPLAGSAQAIAAAAGPMQIQIALSGSAVAQVQGTGALTVGGSSALAGNAQMQVSANGAISTLLPLAGPAQIVASASGNLGTGTALAGAAVVAAAASGNILVTVSLSGAAVAHAIAAGGLALQVPLIGAAVMHAAAAGNLSGGNQSVVLGAPRSLGTLNISHRPPAMQSQRRPAALSRGTRSCR